MAAAAPLSVDWRSVRADSLDAAAVAELEQAVADYKAANRRHFPACTELLAVLRSLGYTRPADAPRYCRSTPRLPRGQRPKPAPTPMPRQQQQADADPSIIAQAVPGGT